MKFQDLVSILLLSIFFVNISFSQTIGSSERSETQVFRLDPDLVKGAKVSELFEEVKFIPLETTKESLFGDIYSLEVCDGYFIIYDADTDAILIFDKNGKFHTKITKRDFDEDKVYLYSFTVASTKNRPTISVESANQHYTFDVDGKILNKVPLQKIANRLKYLYSWTFKDSISLLKEYVDTKDSLTYELALLKNQEVFWKAFPHDTNSRKSNLYRGVISYINNLNDKGLIYMMPNDFNAYNIDFKGAMDIPFRFVFPQAYSLPKDFLTNSEIYNTAAQNKYLLENKSKILSLYSLFSLKNNIFFKCNTIGGLKGKDSYMYDIQQRNLFLLNRLEPDIMSSYLPVMDNGQQPNVKAGAFNKFDGVYFYNCYSSLKMFAFRDENPHKSNIIDPILLDYFKKQSRDSNPVIIQLKPRL